MQQRRFLLLGAVFAAIAVAAGAFGAHALAERVTPERLQTFETAVRYQMYHALALLACGLLGEAWRRSLDVAAWLFTAGILIFSGSLYLLVLTDTAWLGAITRSEEHTTELQSRCQLVFRLLLHKKKE